MPETQHVDGWVMDFVAQFIMPDKDSTNLAGFELLQLFADTGLFQKLDRHGGKRLHRASSGQAVHRGQELIEPCKI